MADADVRINFDLQDVQVAVRKLLQPTMKRIGLHAMRESKANAPRSPTVRQISATLVRKRRTKRRAVPGGLEKSITYTVEFGGRGYEELEAHIFVPKNSPAGAYANYIHNQKGIKWFKRGIGTQKKGGRADEKFIARAVKENERKYSQMIALTVEKATRETDRIVGGSHGKKS